METWQLVCAYVYVLAAIVVAVFVYCVEAYEGSGPLELGWVDHVLIILMSVFWWLALICLCIVAAWEKYEARKRKWEYWK